MTRKTTTTALQLPAIFDCCAPADKEHLATQAQVRLLKKGERVWTDGEPVEALLSVRTGCLGATVRDESGDTDYITVGAYPPATVVARSLSIPKPALFDVHALVGSSVVSIPLFAIRPIAQRTPELYENFSDIFVQALNQQLFFFHRLTHVPVERRLAYVLWTLSRVDRLGRRIIDFKLGQQELAQLVGTDRSELSRRKQLLVKSQMLLQTDAGLELTPSFRRLLASEPGTPGFILETFR